jgi:hypothetical protein
MPSPSSTQAPASPKGPCDAHAKVCVVPMTVTVKVERAPNVIKFLRLPRSSDMI